MSERWNASSEAPYPLDLCGAEVEEQMALFAEQVMPEL
jgi:hypothetical protein